MKKWIIFCVIIMAIILFFIFNPFKSSKNISAITYKVKNSTFVLKVAASGIVEVKPKVELKSKASGEVIYFPFEEGDIVKKGDLVLKLDPYNEQHNLDKAKADLISAKAQLEKAEAELSLLKIETSNQLITTQTDMASAKATLDASTHKLNTTKALLDKNLASEEEFKNALADVKKAESQLAGANASWEIAKKSKLKISQAEADIKLRKSAVKISEISFEDAQQRFEDTKIFAPITGTIIQKNVEVGQIVSSGISSVSGGTVLATIADLSGMYIEATIDETEVGKIKPGLKCSIKADALPESRITGTVNKIYPLGIEDNNVVIFRIKVKVNDNALTQLLPGMTADVDIILKEYKDALIVPIEFISESKKGKFNVNLKNGKIQEVLLGGNNGIQCVVTSGLNPGDIIIKSVSDSKKERRRR